MPINKSPFVFLTPSINLSPTVWCFFTFEIRFWRTSCLHIRCRSFVSGRTWEDFIRETFTAFITARRPSVHPNLVSSAGWVWRDTRRPSSASVNLKNSRKPSLTFTFFAGCIQRSAFADKCGKVTKSFLLFTSVADKYRLNSTVQVITRKLNYIQTLIFRNRWFRDWM